MTDVHPLCMALSDQRLAHYTDLRYPKRLQIVHYLKDFEILMA